VERIVTQEIPQAVIDDPRIDWNPAANTVSAAPPETVETEQMKAQGKRPPSPSISPEREPDTRYAVLLADFRASRQLDADSPMARTEIDRHFQLDDEIPEQRVRALLTQVLESPLVPRVAALIRKRLGPCAGGRPAQRDVSVVGSGRLRAPAHAGESRRDGLQGLQHRRPRDVPQRRADVLALRGGRHPLAGRPRQGIHRSARLHLPAP